MIIKKLGIEKSLFAQLSNLDRLERDHAFIAKLMREQIKLIKFEILATSDKESAEKYKKGFIETDIDWDKQMILVIPTNNSELKAQEVDELLKSKKN